jgi:lysophospholipase L1-like esterase
VSYLPVVLRKAAMAGLIAFGAELAFAYLWPALRQPEFDASCFVGLGEGEPLRAVALGDSTLTAPGLNRAEDIWIRAVARTLAERTGRPVDLRSFGVGGSTSVDVLRDQLPSALALRPHVAFVSVGANDLIRGSPARHLAHNLDAIVGPLRNQGAQVVMSGVGDLGSIPRIAPPLRQMASRLGKRGDRIHAAVAERHGAIKADQWRWAAQQFRTRKDVWSADRFHPNAAGHEIWATTCWEVVEPLCSGLALP